MIVSEKYQYIYIGIPKTGTNSMTDWLLRRFDGKVLGCQHDWSVPDKYRDYTVFTTVRDPWQRCLSLWRFTVMKGKQDMSFASYMRQVLLWSREGCPWYETACCMLKRSGTAGYGLLPA